jgi:hypothetical protein
MADKKISALTAASTPLAGTEVLPIVQSGSTVKASVNNVLGPLSSVSGLTAGYILKGNNTANVSASIAFDSGSAFGIGTNSFTNTVNTAIVRQSGTGVDLGGTATTAAIRIRGGSSGAGLIDFYPVSSDPNSAPFFSGRIFYDHGVNTLAFSANSIEALKLTDTGNVNVSTGNLVMATAGKGIDFSANTHAAGMTSELLNWYETGTWSPSLFDSAGNALTLGTAVGRYTRVGNAVTVTCAVSWTALGSAGATPLILAGLPFAAANVAGLNQSAALGFISGIDTVLGTKQITANLPLNVSYFTFKQTNDNAAPTDLAANSCSATGEIRLSTTYIV